MKSGKSVFSAIIKKVLCSLYEFHQQSSLDTIFLMSNSFSAHTEKTDFSETRNLSYLLRYVYVLDVQMFIFYECGNGGFHGFSGDMNF